MNGDSKDVSFSLDCVVEKCQFPVKVKMPIMYLVDCSQSGFCRQ